MFEWNIKIYRTVLQKSVYKIVCRPCKGSVLTQLLTCWFTMAGGGSGKQKGDRAKEKCKLRNKIMKIINLQNSYIWGFYIYTLNLDFLVWFMWQNFPRQKGSHLARKYCWKVRSPHCNTEIPWPEDQESQQTPRPCQRCRQEEQRERILRLRELCFEGKTPPFSLFPSE